MTKCRMCSQRLTRPGRLCRECERELDRERAAVDGFAAAVQLPGSGGVGPEAATLGAPRSRTVALFAAFVIGIGIAASAYVVQGARGAHGGGTSVMIDRDLSAITPREVRAPVQAQRAAAPAAIAVAIPAASSYDRVLGLADALDRCSDAAPPARAACEARARRDYCGSAGADRITQCITPR
jgi:hypothetical protein